MAKTAPLPGLPGGPRLSFIEPHERLDARAMIDKLWREISGSDDRVRAAGFMVLGKSFIRPEEVKKVIDKDGIEKTIYMPQISATDDKWISGSMLVMDMGPQAYKGKNADGSDRFPEKNWCEIGDWVIVPPNEGYRITYRGVAMHMVADDKILGVISDPAQLTRTHFTHQA